MIIKKKYTQQNNKVENIDEKNDDSQNLSESSVQKSEIVAENTGSKDVDETKAAIEKESLSVFDLSINDIDFEQRAERRDGTRRRGYRRTQDRNIVSRAQQDAVSIKEAAKQDGYKEGLEKAQADINNINEKLGEFFNYKEIVFQKVSECIMDISLEIAKKIINKEIQADKDATISLIKAAVKEVNKTEEKITLKVMPKDVEIVRDSIPDIFTNKYFEAKVYVVPDNSIKEGGVIVETSNGIVDATIETQLQVIQKALKENSDQKEAES